MAREIKFRAWVEGGVGMIYDNIVVYGDGSWGYEVEEEIPCPHEHITALVGYIPKSSDVLMQYTGLKDSKRTEEFPEGVEIYEGDILASLPYDNIEVRWCEEYASFESHALYNTEAEAESLNGMMAPHDCLLARELNGPEDGYEIIGNIHQHPELLEIGE